MVNKFYFEALDRTLWDVLRFSNPNSLHQPFGGKVVVFGEDFRQDIAHSKINSSYLLNYCQVLSLTKNMRLLIGIYYWPHIFAIISYLLHNYQVYFLMENYNIIL